jgi:hypothetical protein
MACGCRKKQQIQKPTVNVTVTEQNNQTPVQLTPEQQNEIQKIVQKIEKITP